MAHIGESRTRRVEIIRDFDTVQIVKRSAGVDDGARACVIQDRNRERVGEGHTDVSKRRRDLLINFLYGY